MTYLEAFEIAVAELDAASGGTWAATTARTEGTVAWQICTMVASSLTELSHEHESGYSALYVDTAGGADLQELGHDHFNLQIQGATAAVADVTFTRVSTVAAHTLAAGLILRTVAGLRFTLDEDVDLAIGATTAVGTVTSVLAGADQEAAAGTIVVFVGAAPASDYTVTNADKAAGGNNLESDEDFRGRIRERDEAAPGLIAGIRRGAIEDVPQVREAAAYEVLDGQGNPAGDVTLVIGDEDGQSNATLETAVDTAMDDWRGAGIPVAIVGATVVLQDIAVSIVWEPSTASLAARNAVRDAIVAGVNRLDPNGAATAAEAPASSILTIGLIEHLARSVNGVITVTVTTPAGTIAPANGEMLRTSRGMVTVS